MMITDIDLRLLRVFRAVVDAGGFSNAQALLNVSQSTISTQMAQLESRVGFRVCQRGRSGFKLTEQGDALYRHVVQLFQALNQFQDRAHELKGELSGCLRIGMLDNILTDAQCPLPSALRHFSEHPDNGVHIALEVLAPQELEAALLDGRIDIAIGIFFNTLPGIALSPLHTERDVLVCDRDHTLASVKEPLLLQRGIADARKVIRTFLGKRELGPLNTDDTSVFATVANVEAAAMLIQTGAYIGFIPEHYAKPWLDSGQWCPLLRDHYSRESQFYLATRSTQQPPSAALALFLQCLKLTQGTPASPRIGAQPQYASG